METFISTVLCLSTKKVIDLRYTSFGMIHASNNSKNYLKFCNFFVTFTNVLQLRS